MDKVTVQSVRAESPLGKIENRIFTAAASIEAIAGKLGAHAEAVFGETEKALEAEMYPLRSDSSAALDRIFGAITALEHRISALVEAAERNTILA